MSYFNNCFIFLNPNRWNSFSARDALKTLTIFFSILVSTQLANVAVWSGFGGAEKNDGVFVFPHRPNLGQVMPTQMTVFTTL